MLPSKAQPSTEIATGAKALRLSAPGKVFIAGEYAVLGNLPALVAAVNPRFMMSCDRVHSDPFQPAIHSFHPKSPVARLLDWAEAAGSERGFELGFESAQGLAGFGSSTAEFALAYAALADSMSWDRSWEKVWKLYRELTSSVSGTGLPPSGADLVAQWNGGVVLFQPGNGTEGPRCENFAETFDWSRILVFSAAGQAGRKVATHEHLAVLSDSQRFSELMASLKIPLDSAVEAARTGNVILMGQALNNYGDALARAGLEIQATRLDREALAALPGVLGVKGAGAMQADAILAVMAPGAAVEKVIETAAARDLVLMCNGIGNATGVTWVH